MVNAGKPQPHHPIPRVLCASCGFAVTKADLFPVVAARSLGQIILNITLPSLMFSKMVPAFTPENISALGVPTFVLSRATTSLCPLVFVAVIYEAIGVIMGCVTRTFFWVPHRFRNGILVAGGWGNVGDIPTSVVMSITGAAPFGGSDQTLSVAYISVFILVYMITLFPMGAHYLIARDFVGPEVEHEEVQEQVRARRKFMSYGWVKAFAKVNRPAVRFDEENLEASARPVESVNEKADSGLRPRPQKHVSFQRNSDANHYDPTHEDATTAVPTDGERTPANFASPAGTVTAHDWEHEQESSTPKRDADSQAAKPVLTASQRRRKRVISRLKSVVKSTLTPASLSMIIAIPIALVPQLKGLFTSTSGSGIPNAPDGEPPLAFILDFTTFMGNASVPLGLICLGSALARLNVPRSEWSNLPVGAIFSLAVLKTVVTPVLGVLITIGLTNVGVISRDDKVLQFVCMFFSCLPTATTQVYLTQVYSGTGSAEFMSPFLLPQYFLMFISMTGLTAYAINYLF